MFSLKYATLFTLLLCACSSMGQAQKDTTALSEIKISAAPIATRLQVAAASIAVIDKVAINTNDGAILTPVLNKIPGVYMQQGALNTNRITIRGMGARTPFGTTRIKTYLDNIPLTTAEGESTIEDIDLETIGSIQIIKGPNATSFGAGLGGIIHLLTNLGGNQKSFVKSNSTYGSFGLLKQSFSGGYAQESANGYVNYSHLQSDGFRQNSSYDRKSLHLQAKKQITTSATLSFLAVYTQLKAFIPSSINETDFTTNPQKAAANWLAAQGFESYDKVLVGVGYDQELGNHWTLKAAVFGNYKKAFEPRPFDILDDQSASMGIRSSLNYKNTFLAVPFEMSVGTEMAFDTYRFLLFRNLYLTQPNQGSVQGAEFSTKKQNSNYQNYFAQMDFSLSTNWHLEAGLALNTTHYALEDLFSSGTAPALQYSFGTILSPRAGLSYSFTKNQTLFAAVSKGFSTPTVAETLTPTGQINTNLQPEIGWNYELGWKGTTLGNKLHTEISFFSTQITNLLVARRTAEDQYIGINAGSSSHVGLEAQLNYKWIKSNNWELSTNFSAAINHFRFKDFVDDAKDYSGNKLTGVPNTQWNFALDAVSNSGFSFSTSYLGIGKIPINDQNSKFTSAYRLVDCKTSYAFTILKSIKATLSAGVNNLTDARYAASIVPNAVGFGTAQPRAYYPGNPRNYYGGFAVNYLF
ncbi:TonB-dependent receptor [Flavobacterium sp.]|uniref:TonB-dependent receptor family protein n=1 Tax=Flavobacterium sp. TaxID=239 RepID=UPI00260AF620|nr:TonB-dependent receptor [Flavobacterium sp.]MDG2431095.1 TonB-dependent receptor [Flavobacterium sp.]